MTSRCGHFFSKSLLQPPESQPLSNFVAVFFTNLRTFSLGHTADIYLQLTKTLKSKKTYRCLLQVYSLHGKYEASLYCYRSFLFSNQEKITAKFAEVKSHLRLRKCKKLPQTYRKLADLWLHTTHYYFAEFAVAE